MTRAAAQAQMRRFAAHSERHFRNDPRYDLTNVTAGFASRFDVQSDDTALLQRICDAYARTVSNPDSARPVLSRQNGGRLSGKTAFGAVIQALAQSDIDKLRKMYGNFFRDPCATGLVGNPFGISIESTLVRSGSEYQHYCAHKILRLLGGNPSVVGEIGGGYGGMAYYLVGFGSAGAH